VTSASPAEYDESICAAAAMRSVATITAATCSCLRLCFSAPAKDSEVTDDQPIVFVDDFVICRRREPMTTSDYASRPTQRHQSSSGSKRCLIYAEVPLNLFYSSYFPAGAEQRVLRSRTLNNTGFHRCNRRAFPGISRTVKVLLKERLYPVVDVV